MKKIKNLFGKIELTWKKLILFAIIAGIYTAVMAVFPITNNTSFKDISIGFEVWILFGIIIIMNSKSAKDSALKCFIFFLISQPLVYLIQVPFSNMGIGIFTYYKQWFIWTIFTIPMGFIGYYLKKNKWWGMLILTPILLLLGTSYYEYLRETMYYFPFHLLSTLFCFITLLIYPIYVFNDKKIKWIQMIISIFIILIMSIMAFKNKIVYSTSILISGDEDSIVFNENYNAYLENSQFGKVYITYDEDVEEYLIKAEFKKAGKTNLILVNESGKETVFELFIGSNTFSINKK